MLTKTLYIAFWYNNQKCVTRVDESDVEQMLEDNRTSGDEHAKEYYQAMLDGEYCTEERLFDAVYETALGFSMTAFRRTNVTSMR